MRDIAFDRLFHNDDYELGEDLNFAVRCTHWQERVCRKKKLELTDMLVR